MMPAYLQTLDAVLHDIHQGCDDGLRIYRSRCSPAPLGGARGEEEPAHRGLPVRTKQDPVDRVLLSKGGRT